MSDLVRLLHMYRRQRFEGHSGSQGVILFTMHLVNIVYVQILIAAAELSIIMQINLLIRSTKWMNAFLCSEQNWGVSRDHHRAYTGFSLHFHSLTRNWHHSRLVRGRRDWIASMSECTLVALDTRSSRTNWKPTKQAPLSDCWHQLNGKTNPMQSQWCDLGGIATAEFTYLTS